MQLYSDFIIQKPYKNKLSLHNRVTQMPKSLLSATLHVHGKPLAYRQGYAYRSLGTADLLNPILQ